MPEENSLFLRDVYALSPVGEKAYRLGGQYRDAKEVLLDADKKSDPEKPTIWKLGVGGPASHSGRIINLRTYPGLKMRDGVATWTQEYNRPILTHHQSGGIFTPAVDPIGRITDSRFNALVSEDELKVDYLSPSKRGSGELLLSGYVAGKDSVEKALDGRFTTVSVGFGTDAIFCSICARDWLGPDGQCDHRPGKMYKVENKDKKNERSVLCYMITGNIKYKEVSYVINPADTSARFETTGMLQDSLQECIDGACDEAQCFLTTPIVPAFYDTLQIGDITYAVVDPKDKEVIVVTDVRREIKLPDVSGAPSCPCDKHAQKGDGVEENMSDKCECGAQDQISVLENKLKDAESQLASVKEDNKALTDKTEVLTKATGLLQDKVRSMLAETLLDLRITSGQTKLSDAVEGEPNPRQVALDKLRERTTESLEDAIVDTREFIANLPPAVVAPAVQERGTVSSEDAGVQVDTSADEPKITKVDETKKNRRVNLDFKSLVMEKLR